MSEHADRALASVSGSFTDPAHRLAAAQVHATLAVAEAVANRPVVIDTLTGAQEIIVSQSVNNLNRAYTKAWYAVMNRIETMRTNWGSTQLLGMMNEELEEAIKAVNT